MTLQLFKQSPSLFFWCTGAIYRCTNMEIHYSKLMLPTPKILTMLWWAKKNRHKKTLKKSLETFRNTQLPLETKVEDTTTIACFGILWRPQPAEKPNSEVAAKSPMIGSLLNSKEDFPKLPQVYLALAGWLILKDGKFYQNYHVPNQDIHWWTCSS